MKSGIVPASLLPRVAYVGGGLQPTSGCAVALTIRAVPPLGRSQREPAQLRHWHALPGMRLVRADACSTAANAVSSAQR